MRTSINGKTKCKARNRASFYIYNTKEEIDVLIASLQNVSKKQIMSGDPIYTEMIIEYSRNPSNFGKLVDAHIHQHDSNPLCGDSIDLYLNIDDNKISDVKFDGKGCAICMACSSVLTEMIKGKSLDDVKKFEKDDLLSELGLEHLIKTSPVRIKCALLSLKSLKYGIYSYFADKMNDAESAGNLNEEAMPICIRWKN